MPTASLFDIAAIVLTLAAAFGTINQRWMRLPPTIGLVLIALTASLFIIALDAAFPRLGFGPAVRGVLSQIDFHEALMKGMLSFLLFAGALHVNFEEMWARRWAIGGLATAGVVLSTALVGTGFYAAASGLGLALPLAYCLVFAALISPTDPVAVMSILKRVAVPDSLKAKIAGESLLNDGVGVVIFAILAAAALGVDGHGGVLGAGDMAILFAREAVGGGALGLATGALAYRALKSMDEHNLEVLITLALVMMTYSIAMWLHVSGPIAVVVAGLLIGNHGARFAMSDTTRDHVRKFWSLLDEILNAALFLLIGFEVMALAIDTPTLVLMALTIPIVLTARLASVAIPITLLALRRTFTPGAIPVLTWGGLRGGISVALALSLPDIPARGTILAVTYGVVIFSLIVQGLTIERVIRRLVPRAPTAPPPR